MRPSWHQRMWNLEFQFLLYIILPRAIAQAQAAVPWKLVASTENWLVVTIISHTNFTCTPCTFESSQIFLLGISSRPTPAKAWWNTVGNFPSSYYKLMSFFGTGKAGWEFWKSSLFFNVYLLSVFVGNKSSLAGHILDALRNNKTEDVFNSEVCIWMNQHGLV